MCSERCSTPGRGCHPPRSAHSRPAVDHTGAHGAPLPPPAPPGPSQRPATRRGHPRGHQRRPTRQPATRARRAINERNRNITADQTRRALQQLSIGDRVRLDNHVSPRYLQGRTGTIHQIDATTVTVCLDTPAGRFTDGHVTCSPRALHPIHQPPT